MRRSIAVVLACYVTAGYADSTLDFDVALEFDETAEQIESTHWNLVRVSQSWKLGSDLSDWQEIRVHRFDTRLRWEQLLDEHWYAAFDGKVILRLWEDQQSSGDQRTDMDGRLRELSLQRSQGSWNIKAGMQTIIWGEMDTVRINDVMTPWDYSEPVFTAPEDARLAQASIVGEWFDSNNKMSIVLTPWVFSNKYPSGGTGSLLGFMLGTDQFSIDDDRPEPLVDMEYGLRIKRIRPGGDMALYLASVLSNDPLFSVVDNTRFETRYPRTNVFGLSGNLTREKVIWKAEAAFKPNFYITGPQSPKRDTVETAVGFDYNDNGRYDASVEFMHQHIMAGDGELTGLKQDNPQLAMRVSKDFLYDTFNVVYFFSYQFNNGDMIHSASLQYAINDISRVDTNVTWFDIQNQDSPYRFTDDWDQVSIKFEMDY